MTSAVPPAGEGGGHALPRGARITTTEEIRTLFRRGKRRKTRHLDVFVSASPVARSRIGLVVPKPRARTRPGAGRIRAAAVQRNRLKRRLREIARIEILPRLERSGCRADVMVRARPEAYDASFGQLRQELIELEEWVCSSVA
ncbi:MAG: ribonuclease P protein component [Gemmatimonadota bacterium]